VPRNSPGSYSRPDVGGGRQPFADRSAAAGAPGLTERDRSAPPDMFRRPLPNTGYRGSQGAYSAAPRAGATPGLRGSRSAGADLPTVVLPQSSARSPYGLASPRDRAPSPDASAFGRPSFGTPRSVDSPRAVPRYAPGVQGPQGWRGSSPAPSASPAEPAPYRGGGFRAAPRAAAPAGTLATAGAPQAPSRGAAAPRSAPNGGGSAPASRDDRGAHRRPR
jgi:hypothetical protein